ncbi:MAG: hypothetical protein HZA11_05945 [Nitrospirae bacterium]|nr:hypothetical protein [Nitrospirota bacterium]
MKIVAMVMLIFLSGIHAFAGDGVPVFTDNDLEKYKKSSDGAITHEKKAPTMVNVKDIQYAEQQKEPKNEFSDSDRKEIESQLRQIWTAMSAKLVSGDIEGALDYFVDGVKDRYRKTFKDMSESKLKAVFSNVSDFKLGVLYDRKAECGAIRIEGGKRYSYPVSFVRQDNGGWKIYGF